MVKQTIGSSFSALYETHAPISIFGDAQFSFIALIENWPGEGTPSDPFIIEGYNITASKALSENLISIKHTAVFFIIRNCYLNGLSEAWAGILFYNVMNGIVDNNTVINIDILGIGVYFSETIIIANNHVENTNLNGIRIEACPGPVNIVNNTITNSVDAGIWIGDSSYETTIINNTIYENQFGIMFGRDDDEYQGVFSSFISGNLIYNHTYGIELSYSYNNSIFGNFISDTRDYGVLLLYPCENTEIKDNNFLDNNLGGKSQAKDDGTNNIFRFNFWNDYTDPDTNNDGIVDVPYAIDGEANNIDFFPLTKSTDTPPKQSIPLNIIAGVIFLVFIIGTLAILLVKNTKRSLNKN